MDRISPSLQISTLGGLSIRLAGEPVSGFASRKVQALLVYLACTAREQPREVLAEFFWEERPQAQAMGNLRVALNSLRKLLGAYVFITRDMVALNQGEVWLDAAQLEEKLSAGEAEGAVALYQGDFLDGFYIRGSRAFEDWALLERERMRRLVLDALQDLSAHHLNSGDYRSGIRHTTRLLEMDPLMEEAHQQMMRLLAFNGQRGEALAQYESCRTMLEEEFGVEPSEETHALYDKIVAGEIRAPPPQPIPVVRGEKIPAQRPAFLESEAVEEVVKKPVFVARERELARLDAFLERALDGKGQVVFIAGGPGRGKTALLDEFAQRAMEAHLELLVASGGCNAYSGVGDPYLPFREVLGMLTGDVESHWSAGSITRQHALRLWDSVPLAVQALLHHGPHLVDIFYHAPALLSRAAAAASADAPWLQQLAQTIDRPPAGTEDREQSRLFQQVTHVLRALAEEKPLLLILDDMQWADTTSTGLFFHVGRRLEGSRILVACAYRPQEVALGRDGERHPLEKALNEFKRQLGDVWVDLGQAEEEAGVRFVNALLDTEPNRLDEGFRRTLFEHTRGHPLFTVELLRSMQERGDLLKDEGGHWVEGPALQWEALPARVEGVIEERIGRLEEELRRTLSVASVEGEDFTAQVVARVEEVNERKLIRQLSQELDKKHRLVGEQGIREVGGQRLYQYRFRHNLFQRYLYNGLGEIEREMLHLDIGAVLETLYQERIEQIAPQLAWHFLQAGGTDKAVRYLLLAGDAAAAAYANAEAVQHYTRALELAKQGEARSEELTQVYSGLGRALELNSQFDQALANYEEMEELAYKRGDRPLGLASLMARVTLHATFTPIYNPARAQALAEQALTLAHDLGDQTAEAKILWNLLLVYRAANKLSKAIECGERSLALARSLDLREQMAFTLNDLGSQCYFINGSFNRARAVLREASGLWQELDNLPMLANSLASSCAVCVYIGEYDRALSLSQEAFQINQSINNLWGQSHSRYKVGYAYWDRGQPDRAITLMEECIRLSELAGFTVPQVFTRADLAAVYGGLGAIERGLEIAQLSLTIAETQFPIVQVYVMGVLAHIHVLNGDLLEAESAVDQGKNDPNREAVPTFFVSVRLAEGELALRQGDDERALAVTDDLLGDLRQFGMRAYIPQVLYLQAQALLGLGQDDAARNLWLEARAEAEAIGSRRMLWQILVALSQLETDPTEAERLRQEAREIVEYIADHISAPELRASFRNLPQVRAVSDSTAAQ